MNDRISELIINIKNATMVNKPEVLIPHSILKEKILNAMKKEGYIGDYKILKGDGVKKKLKISLLYENGKSKIIGLKRISKPSKRIYYGYKNILPIKYGHGVMFISSPKGIITDKIAKKEKVGGEPLFKI